MSSNISRKEVVNSSAQMNDNVKGIKPCKFCGELLKGKISWKLKIEQSIHENYCNKNPSNMSNDKELNKEQKN
jgi:hypothetical protein